jgi:hypothetical protein
MLRKRLADVPEQMLLKPSHVRAGVKWESDYNVALWLRFKQIGRGTVNIYLHWHDDNGEHAINVDRSAISSDSILLSGIAHLRITGQIRSMGVSVETDNNNFSVDELFVQPARSASVKKQA